MTKLVFLNNFIVPGTMEDQMWSVACEFQFYLVSPFIVMYMADSDHSWVLLTVLALLSLACNYLIVQNVCPEFTETMQWQDSCELDLINAQYVKVYCRVAPYLTGMYAGYIHFNGGVKVS